MTFDYILQSKILDSGEVLLLLNLQRPWTIVFKDVDHVFELEYSTYHILNRSELCECSLTAGNYFLSQTTANYGDVPEAKDGFLMIYYALNKIVLDILTEILHITVEHIRVTQSVLLHNDIQGYNLPTMDFMSPPEEPKENQILQKDDFKIYTHLENVLAHIIDEQDAQMLKSECNYERNQKKFTEYLKYAGAWQSASIICSHVTFLCNILLIVTFIVFFIRYCKTMQAMLMVFLSMNTSSISPAKANVIGRTFPSLFTLNLPEKERIIEDLDDIKGMQVTIQAISSFVLGIILYQMCKRCRYTCSIVEYCFPFFPVSGLLRSTWRIDLFLEVTNLTKGNTTWVLFTATGYYPMTIKLSRQIPKENVHMEITCFCFKKMYINNWENTVVTGILGIETEDANRSQSFNLY